MWYDPTRDHGCGMDHPRFDGRCNNGFEASQRSRKARGDETLQIQELHNKQLIKYNYDYINISVYIYI